MADAKSNPVHKAKQDLVHSDDIKLDDAKVNLSKAATDGLDEVQVLVETDTAKAVAYESFLADVIEVHLGEPADENDFPFVYVCVNGVAPKVMRRGEVHRMKRSEVEVLARSKIARVRTERRVAPDGSETMEPRVSYHATYPFSIIHDPAGAKGLAWLKNLLAQPA